MKITKERLRRIIKEEIEAVVDEGLWSKAKAKMGLGSEKFSERLSYLDNQVSALEDLIHRHDRGGAEASPEELLRQVSAVQKMLGGTEAMAKETGMTSDQKASLDKLVSDGSHYIKMAQRLVGTERGELGRGGDYGV